jgi:hypothetical protein
MKSSGEYSAFISYASDDREKAEGICTNLEAQGFVCWIAPRDVRAGREYADEIIRGLERSAAVVLVLSEAANTSVFVRREVERAVSKQKPVFPVRIEDVTPSPGLELFISGTHWIDAWTGRWDDHMTRLARDLGDASAVPPAPDISAGRRSLPGRRSFPLAYAAGAALVVVLSGMAIWWFSGGPPQQAEMPLRPRSAPAAVQNSRAPGGQQERGQVQVPASEPVNPAPPTRSTQTRRTPEPDNERTVSEVRPAGRPAVAAADPTPAALEASRALNALRDDYDDLSSRGEAIDETLNRLWEDMKPLSPRVDMVTHQRSLKTNLTRSRDALAQQDAAAARRYLGIARADLEALEQFLNR